MKELVIIGGGFAGTKIAGKLQKVFKVTLIDNKDYFEFTPGILKSLVHPERLKSIEAHHKDYLKKTKVIKDLVVAIKNKNVILKNGRAVKFDYLVIASGSKYTSPIKTKDIVLADKGTRLTAHHEKFKRCKNMIIVGGGLVGVELAGEITERYSEKKVTIIHSGDCLMKRNNAKSRKFVKEFLEKRGVKLIFNERVQKMSKGFVETDKKNKFECDLAILCTGIKPNSEFMSKTLLDWKGFIEVNNHLQMRGSGNIFVCGDVAAINEEKTAQAAEKQADVVITNLKLMEKQKSLERYHSKIRPAVISLGRRNGIFEHGNFVMTGLIPAFLKWAIERKTMQKYRRI